MGKKGKKGTGGKKREKEMGLYRIGKGKDGNENRKGIKCTTSFSFEKCECHRN